MDEWHIDGAGKVKILEVKWLPKIDDSRVGFRGHLGGDGRHLARQCAIRIEELVDSFRRLLLPSVIIAVQVDFC